MRRERYKYVIGDRIAYKAAFLRSIMDYSYDSASRRGTVVAVKEWPLIQVKWDDKDEPSHVGKYNIVLASRIHLEPV